ncbi:hypothetical protein V6N13_115160 [Hibiscus sabdariffa]
MYVNPAELVVKGNIIWSDNSNDLSVLATTSLTQFKIVAAVFPVLRPTKVLSFEDTKQKAFRWKDANESL